MPVGIWKRREKSVQPAQGMTADWMTVDMPSPTSVLTSSRTNTPTPSSGKESPVDHTARRRNHRRSRSMSELVSNTPVFSSNDPILAAQPWRSRTAWAALHADSSSPSWSAGAGMLLPSGMDESTGWRGRGGGVAFFGADRYLPRAQRCRGGSEQVGRVKLCDEAVPSVRIGDTLSPPGPLLSLREVRSTRNLRSDHTISVSSDSSYDTSASSYESSTLQTPQKHLHYVRYSPTFSESDDEDEQVLPPLLPSPGTRKGSYSSIRDSPHIPWGRASSPAPSLRTPRSPPRTPARRGFPISSTTSPLSVSAGTPKTWTYSSPSPPLRSKLNLSRGPDVDEYSGLPARTEYGFSIGEKVKEVEAGEKANHSRIPAVARLWTTPLAWAEANRRANGEKATEKNSVRRRLFG